MYVATAHPSQQVRPDCVYALERCHHRSAARYFLFHHAAGNRCTDALGRARDLQTFCGKSSPLRCRRIQSEIISSRRMAIDQIRHAPDARRRSRRRNRAASQSGGCCTEGNSRKGATAATRQGCFAQSRNRLTRRASRSCRGCIPTWPPPPLPCPAQGPSETPCHPD